MKNHLNKTDTSEIETLLLCIKNHSKKTGKKLVRRISLSSLLEKARRAVSFGWGFGPLVGTRSQVRPLGGALAGGTHEGAGASDCPRGKPGPGRCSCGGEGVDRGVTSSHTGGGEVKMRGD